MRKIFGKIRSFFKCFGVKTPEIKDNTFIVWEPCSKSHAEVVPGFVKYLLDLGYHVSVLLNVERYDEGLFDRFGGENISFNFMSKRNIRKLFNFSQSLRIISIKYTHKMQITSHARRQNVRK